MGTLRSATPPRAGSIPACMSIVTCACSRSSTGRARGFYPQGSGFESSRERQCHCLSVVLSEKPAPDSIRGGPPLFRTMLLESHPGRAGRRLLSARCGNACGSCPRLSASSLRLVARIALFQSVEDGSEPSGSTISACPGKVDTGFPKRTCANVRRNGSIPGMLPARAEWRNGKRGRL